MHITSISINQVYHNNIHLFIQGCHGQGKVREKQTFFKVRECYKKSGKILVLVNVSEKSGNFG